MTARMRLDTQGLDHIDRTVDENTMDALTKLGASIVNDIRSNWFPRSPSPRGGPPAVVTGALDATIRVDRQGRDLLGRLAGKDAMTLFIRAGSDDVVYAGILEDGLNRPFFVPALERASERTGKMFKDVVRVR